MALTEHPRSVRNNNPGNLEGHDPWEGLDNPSHDELGYCRFVTARYGFRALAKDVHHKWAEDRLRDVRQIITKFAPPSENDTAAYIRAMCDMTGHDPDAPLDLNDPAQLTPFCRGIAFHEAGGWFFETEDLVAGVRLALGAKA